MYQIFYLRYTSMQHQAILYSLDPKITFKQLQDQKDSTYDEHKYNKLQEWITEHEVWCCMDVEEPFHYKFFPIRPKVHIFYYLGDLWLLNKKILGIVGPRKMSNYGKKVLETVFTIAADYDFVTVSGMAEGVDQLCHQLSQEHHIPTIAVLGWGLGRYLKRPECRMIDQIVANGGLVISEYKLGEQASKYTFPQRNRLIAGLADLVFLPEAGEKSGSLITVDCALAMKKPVYATPNTIFAPTSAGILHYMEIGSVKPIFDLQKFLSSHFPSTKISSRPKTTIILSEQEQWLLSILSRDQGQNLQSIVQTIWGDIQESITLLTMLEIKWLVSQEEPGKYVLV